MAKTILKLHANGDLETVGTALSFLTPSDNLFVIANMTPGYVHRETGEVRTDNNDNLNEGASEFIPVNVGETYTIQVNWDDTTLRYNGVSGWSFWSVAVFDKDLKYISRLHESNSSLKPTDFRTFTIPDGVAFIRITASHLYHIYNNKRCTTVSFVKGYGRKPYIESLQDQLQQGKALYSFNKDLITVPTIIEYPPSGYRNYFIEKTCVAGNINPQGQLLVDGYGITTDFIPVSNGEQVTVSVTYSNIGINFVWTACAYYNAERQFITRVFGSSVNQQNFQRTLTIPNDVAFIRYSFNDFGYTVGEVKVSIEKKSTATLKHYLAPEELPNWVRDTGNPISIFPQGIVIKGDLIHTELEPEPPESDVLFMDDFNRADSDTLGDNWTLGRGSFVIENNMAKATGGVNVSSTAFATFRHGDNVSISADIRRNVSESLIFRASDAFNTVFAHLEGADLKLKQTINSTTTTLKTVNLNTSTTAIYRVRVELRGTEIKVYVDDTLHITHVLNSNLNNTLCGIHSWSNNATNGRFDSFIVKKLPINE